MRASNKPVKPRVGVVGLAYPGYHLGEEGCGPKLDAMLELLSGEPLDLVRTARPVFSEADARQAGDDLAAANVDCVLAVVSTFVPDTFIVELVDRCDVPVFLWCVERELGCLALVCGPLATASLFDLKKHYRLAAADVGDTVTRAEFLIFARAAMLRRCMRAMRVGYSGGRPPIMLSLSADEYTLKNVLGVTTVSIPVQEIDGRARSVDGKRVLAAWEEIRKRVGKVCVRETDGRQSVRYLLAAGDLCAEMGLNALSLNCFPHLKSRVCLAVARLNDAGISAACEGDLHSTVLMHLLRCLTGRPSFNGDFLRMYPGENDVLFSHCGAGAFSLAACRADIRLQSSIETRDGLAVCYATKPRGPVTLVNLMGARETFRLALMQGESVACGTEYEGTPLRVHFTAPVRGILRQLAETGAGHHWNGAFGGFTRELALFCAFTGLRFNLLTKESEP